MKANILVMLTISVLTGIAQASCVTLRNDDVVCNDNDGTVCRTSASDQSKTCSKLRGPDGTIVKQDPPGTHGMLVFGEKSVYFSHLPMYHKPHDYQILFKSEMSADGLKAYQQDKKEHPEEKIYTFVPEVMVLPEAIKITKTFKGDLYRGHFERDGVVIKKDVTVNVSDLVYYSKFSLTASKPAEATELLLGDNSEAWLVHLIYAKPEFDQVLKVKTNLPLERSAIVQLKGVDHGTPLQAGQTYQTTQSQNISVSQEQYLELDDLAM